MSFSPSPSLHRPTYLSLLLFLLPFLLMHYMYSLTLHLNIKMGSNWQEPLPIFFLSPTHFIALFSLFISLHRHCVFLYLILPIYLFPLSFFLAFSFSLYLSLCLFPSPSSFFLPLSLSFFLSPFLFLSPTFSAISQFYICLKPFHSLNLLKQANSHSSLQIVCRQWRVCNIWSDCQMSW